MVLSATSVWNGRCAVVADFFMQYRGVVYMYISPEEKVYIGITIDERRRRACWFRSGSYSGFRVAAARKKYSPELWEYRVLRRFEMDDVASLLDSLAHEEVYFIDFYKATNPSFGYNVVSGGIGFTWAAASAEDRHALGLLRAKAVWQYDYAGRLVGQFESAVEAASQTGSNHSSICQCCRGLRPAHNGFQWRWAGESARVLSAEEISVIESTQPISVSQYSMSGKFIRSYISMAEAGRLINFDSSLIARAARGELQSAGGYQWRRDDIDIPVRVLREPKRLHRTKVAVDQYTLDGVFVASYPSYHQASIASGADNASIMFCAEGTGDRASAGGYLWAFPGASVEDISNRVARAAASMGRLKNTVKKKHYGWSTNVDVFNLDGSLYGSFLSISEASRVMGIGLSTVAHGLDRDSPTKGYYFRRALK